MVGVEAAPKRSARQRAGGGKLRVFDVHMRNEIKRKRLAALEQDNGYEERNKVAEEDDEEYMDSGGSDEGARMHAHTHARALPRHFFSHVLLSAFPHRGGGGQEEAKGPWQGGKGKEKGQEGRLECRAKVQIAHGDFGLG